MGVKTRTHQGEYIDILIKDTQEKSTLYISTPTRLVPKAVDRNKIRRWCRELWWKSALAIAQKQKSEVRLRKSQRASFAKLSSDFRNAEIILLNKGKE